MFYQLEVLRYCFPSSVRRVLDEFPESLDETHERILGEIKKPSQVHALRLLQCLVVAVRPLKVEELAEVLLFDFSEEGIPKPNLDWLWEDQEEAIMSTCSNLVMIVNDRKSRIVQFSHFSVKEFLTSKRLAEPIRGVSRTITFDSIPLIRSLYEPASVPSSSSDVIMVTWSRTFHCLSTPLDTGTPMPGLGMSHQASRRGYDVYLTRTSLTLKHGSIYTAQTLVSEWGLTSGPRNLE